MTTKVTPSLVANNVTYGIDIYGNANTVDNGVYTTGSYSNPSWITSLASSKISGNITGSANAAAHFVGTNWTIHDAGTKLNFKYNGTVVFSIDSNGAIIAKNDITGFGTP